MAWYLIQYDIANEKRLQRVYRYLKRCAFPVQGSVFAWQGELQALNKLKKELKALINPKEDDIRGYELYHDLWLFGENPFLDNIYFSGLPPHVFCALEKLTEINIPSEFPLYELVNLLRRERQ